MDQNEAPDVPTADTNPLGRVSPQVRESVQWFTEQVRSVFGDNLCSLTVYGPAVTSIFDAREHRIHHLIALDHHDFDQLMSLSRHAPTAARRRLTPPLVLTEKAIRDSHDVFALEWLDISQFSQTVVGESCFGDLELVPRTVRLQCESEIRSLEILMHRGVLASGGIPRRIRRLEDEAADRLVRVLRGISWLAGDRHPLFPDALCQRCAEIAGRPLDGVLETIRPGGRHDVETVRQVLKDLSQLGHWIDRYEVP